jgi:hypothetical protein
MIKRPTLISLLLMCPALFAQTASNPQPIPINSGNVDYVTSVTSAVDDLVTSGSPLFLSTGNDLLTAIGIIMLVIYGLKWATHSASRHHPEFDFPGVIHFFALFLIAEAMLRYYDAPLPWTSSSFHQILPDTARQLAGTIDLTSMDALLGRINSIVTTTERPGITDPLMFVVYIGLLIDMILIEGILFAVTILGFIAVGIGSVLGPIFIPWLIVPRLSWLFWNWIQFMLQYSFYRVVASALTFVWTTVIVKFLDNAVQGDYSLAHFLLMLVPLGMLNIGMIFSVFRVTSFVSDLFKGTAAAGGGLAGSVAGAIRGAFA